MGVVGRVAVVEAVVVEAVVEEEEEAVEERARKIGAAVAVRGGCRALFWREGELVICSCSL